MTQSVHRTRWLLLVGLLLAFALRVYHLGDQNIWWDEGLAVWAVRHSFMETTLWTARDVHPPLYFWLLWPWVRLAGESEFAARYLTVMVAMLTVAAMAPLGRRLGGRAVGVAALWLLALSRFHVWWSQEMRMYALAALVATLSFYFLVRTVSGNGKEGQPVGAGLAPAPQAPAPLLIPGVEISTYHGHANLWPVTDWADFRCWRDDQMRRIREWAREHGALFSVNHPKDDGPPWAFGDFFGPDCMEVWGAPWFISNYQALAVWDALLREGHRITAVGGSDKHQGPFTGELGWYELGNPTTWVWAEELSIPAVVAGLRAGHVFISEGPADPLVELIAEAAGHRAMMGDELPLPPGATVRLTCRVRGAAGCLLRLVSARRVLQTEISADDFTNTWEILPEGDRYFRPEVIDPPEAPLDEEPGALMMRAMGNPVYLMTNDQ